MYRTTLRSASRPVIASLRSGTVRAAPRRFASTATPTNKPRSWKGSALRLGLAFGALYYYNTSPVFADEAVSQTIPPPAAFSDNDLPTVDSVLEEKRKKIKSKAEKPAEKEPAESTTAEPKPAAESTVAANGSPAALEQEADQQGAFNPETGEINWDCPCLGGMAHGPCGEEFKTAFSCFVYSTEEPKGMDCIEKFQGMQECFKKYPEIYGAELADDEDGAPTPDFGDEQPAPDAQKSQPPAPPQADAEPAPAPAPVAEKPQVEQPAPVDVKPVVEESQSPSREETRKPELETEPKQSHDATAANEEVALLEKQEAKKEA